MIELDMLVCCPKYVKQKSALEKELENFLQLYNQDLENVTPYFMRLFLIHKDSGGKTRVHTDSCSANDPNTLNCPYPLRLAAGSVDSLIGKLRAILRDSRKGSEWNETLLTGNPMASMCIKRHLKAVRIEQT
ncbi:hypothetical protein SNE40_021280 [Patella caerulea]|uniref:ALOG domain-containing protein n=1 Tax=Patella caerulea TaxID=87958 RepID=A0AAN8FZ63_PATCE